MPNYLSFRTSRISTAQALSVHDCFGPLSWWIFAAIAILLIFSLFKNNKQFLNAIMGLFAGILMGLLFYWVARSPDHIPYEVSGSSRISLGAGFILNIVALNCIIIKCNQFIKMSWLRIVVGGTGWLCVAVLLVTGQLDTYSIMKEYLGVENQFWRDAWHHLALSIITLLTSVIVGVPLGYWCIKSSFTDKVILTGLNITETIPVMALFAVLRIPFSALGNNFAYLKQLGIGGYGIAPAFGALFLYALYLIVHNVRAAFLSIDENYIENAYAMGMTSRDVFWKVRIPMALPIILTGIRIAFISTLIGASLASYVGGGGLGVYIVNGISSLAMDMLLLGVIPIFVMTIVADYLLRLLINHSFPKSGVAEHDFIAGGV